MIKLTKTKLLASLILAILFSITCSNSSTANNPAPLTVKDQTFTVSENANVGDDAIATIEVASKPENKPLTYSIATNDNALFKINPTSGVLGLADGKSLDYETKTLHSIMVKVTDGEMSSTVTITLMVENDGSYCGDATTTTPVALYNKVANTPLRLDPLIASGNGTEANPYVVPIDTDCADFTFIYDPSPNDTAGLSVPSPGRVYFIFDLASSGYKFSIHHVEALQSEIEGAAWQLNAEGIFTAESFTVSDNNMVPLARNISGIHMVSDRVVIHFLSDNGTPTYRSQKGWRLQKMNCNDPAITCS